MSQSSHAISALKISLALVDDKAKDNDHKTNAVEQFKSEFERLRTRKFPAPDLNQTFYLSNDLHSLPEILPEPTPVATAAATTGFSNHAAGSAAGFAATVASSNSRVVFASSAAVVTADSSAAGPASAIAVPVPVACNHAVGSNSIVNFLVAKSDIFSILHKLEGDAIICDVDRKLLKFIEDYKEYLLELYEKYKNQQISFTAIPQFIFKKFLEQYVLLYSRMEFLHAFHFLFDEENYVRAMEALLRKKIVTLDINLFDSEEQKLLCQQLRAASLQVKLFNATNLPDYDETDALLRLFKTLPWASSFTLLWNIHDRGPLPLRHQYNTDMYTQYCFEAHSVSKYRDHLDQRPILHAEMDHLFSVGTIDLLNEYKIYEGEIIRYAKSYNRKFEYNMRLHELNESKASLDPTVIQKKFSMRYAPRNLVTEDFFISQL